MAGSVTASDHTGVMAFGQQSGPPASHRQVQTLLELLVDAGHSDFRDARGPMGFTQRQANGKFTVDEAQAFIDQLEAAAYEAEDGAEPTPKAVATAPSAPAPQLKVSRTEKLLADLPDDVLAAELQRRGWIVAAP